MARPLKLTPRPKKLKLRAWAPSENQEQKTVIDWATKIGIAKHPELFLLYAVPNSMMAGGRSRWATVNHMKSMGMRNGVPDLCLPIGRGGYHSLYIEMKTKDGELSNDQDRYIAVLRYNVNRVEVCRSANDAIDTIKQYLDAQ